MKQITKTAQLVLSYFPAPAKNIIRKIMPLKLKRTLGQQVMTDAAKKGGVIAVNDGRRFNIIEDRLFLRVLFEKDYEPLLTAVATNLLKQKDNVIDVGANFGWYTTLFSKCVYPGKVISYEPAPRSSDILEQNIALNKMEAGIDVRKVCVGDEPGSLVLELGSTSDSGLAHVVKEASKTTTEVPVVCLDDDISNIIGEIAYIKIDVEGYELSTLKGAKKILNVTDQPIIQIELNNEALERAGTSRSEAVTFLKSFGYSFWEVVPNNPGKLKKTDAEQCSDVFCFGRGKYAQRVHAISYYKEA